MNNVFAYKLVTEESESLIEYNIGRDVGSVMAKKVAVVTGGNKGIGFAIVKSLCLQFDGDVFLTARDEDRGKAAVKQLQIEGLNPKFHLLDITKIESIKLFASFLNKQYGGLDVLVNNAAIGYLPGNPTPFAEQAKKTLKTNFFGTLNVCNELFPLLRPHARVVNMSSSTGRLSVLSNKELNKKFLSASREEELCNIMNEFLDDVNAGINEEKGWGTCSYRISKIGITALTFIQHRNIFQHHHRDIVVNAVHPGRCSTDLVAYNGTLTADEGAVVPVYLALLPHDVLTPRGEYVWCDKSVKSWL